MTALSCSKNNCLKIKWHLKLAKLMTWGDSQGGFVQLQPSSRLPGRHSKAHFSHKDGENKRIWSLIFLHILFHIYNMLVGTLFLVNTFAIFTEVLTRLGMSFNTILYIAIILVFANTVVLLILALFLKFAGVPRRRGTLESYLPW